MCYFINRHDIDKLEEKIDELQKEIKNNVRKVSENE